MSINLSSVAREEFDSIVKHAYQGMSVLRPCVTIRNNVVGDTVTFRRMGKGLAKQKASQDMVVPMDVGHTNVTATLQNWHASEFTDIFDDVEVNFDEMRELATTVAGACGRRLDQIIIDTLDAGTPDASDIAAGAANLTVAKMIDAQVALRDQGVPNSDLAAVIEANGLGGLLNDEKATSADYMAIKALVQGDLNSFCGFTIKVIESRDEGGLTEAANIVDSWFFHKDAVGLGIGIDFSTEMSYQELYTSYLVTGKLKAGAAIRDNGGFVKVQYDKTA